MLELIKLHSNGNGTFINGAVEGYLTKLTLIVKSNKEGSVEIISSKSEPYNPESERVEIKKSKIKYNILTGKTIEKIKECFSNIYITETSVYLGIKINNNDAKYDLLITPLAKNRVKIHMSTTFLDLMNLEHKKDSMFNYMGWFKIENLTQVNYLLDNYKDYLEME